MHHIPVEGTRNDKLEHLAGFAYCLALFVVSWYVTYRRARLVSGPHSAGQTYYIWLFCYVRSDQAMPGIRESRDSARYDGSAIGSVPPRNIEVGRAIRHRRQRQRIQGHDGEGSLAPPTPGANADGTGQGVGSGLEQPPTALNDAAKDQMNEAKYWTRSWRERKTKLWHYRSVHLREGAAGAIFQKL